MGGNWFENRLEEFNNLETSYKWGLLWVLLECLYIAYWIIAMFIIVFDDNASAEQRTFHAFLAIHIVTLPAVLLYIIETRNKKKYWFVVWVLIASFFLDLYGIIDANLHLIKHIPIGGNTSFELIRAAAIIAPCISFLVIVWYIIVTCQTRLDVKKLKDVFGEQGKEYDPFKEANSRIKNRLRV